MNPQPSPSTSLIHTHINQRNPAGLLVHLQRQYNATGRPVRSQGCTCNPTRLLCIHRDTPSHKTPIEKPPSTFPPTPGSMFCIPCIRQVTARLSVCARQVRGSILRNFCRLVAYLCRVVSLRQQSGRGLRLVAPPRGPRGLPPPRIFMFLEGMKTAIVLSHSPGPWRARRLDRADVDSRVWLASARTYIAFAVPFMV